MACGIVVRACGGDQGALWRYAGYVAIYVWLPGVLVLGAFSGRRVSWVDALAVGLPVGFAIEIFTYVLLSVLGLRVLFAWSPVVWVVGLLLPAGRRARWRDASPTVAGWRPWLICALAGVGLVMVVTTAAHYYVAAPLSPQGGLLAATHQDWIYLISRAAELKLRWPWSDPSLAGTPLSYHYFLMVHLAAASTVTRIALSELLLRLCVLPLTVALIMQGFVLGRALTHRAAGGVLAVVLFLVADQVSFAGAVEANPFSDLFVHWLYISPTFFFGMVFLGAVLIWAHRVVVGAAVRLMDLLILAVLAAAATGAKGSVMPPLLLALGAWMVVEIVVRRRFPWRMLAAIGAMTVGFGVVYFPVLRGWGTGAARFVPLVSLQVADFWTAHLLTWQRALTAAGLSESLSRWLAQAACAGVILAGSHGVRLLAWPYLWGFRRRAEPGLTVWLGSVYLASLLFGWFIYLDSQAQLYVYYQMRLPAAVLAAGAVISLYSAGQRRWNEGGQAAWSYPGMLALGLAGGTLIILVVSDGLSPWLAMVALGLAALAMPRRWLRADQPTAPAAEVGGGWRMVGGLAPVLLVGAICSCRSITGGCAIRADSGCGWRATPRWRTEAWPCSRMAWPGFAPIRRSTPSSWRMPSPPAIAGRITWPCWIIRPSTNISITRRLANGGCGWRARPTCWIKLRRTKECAWRSGSSLATGGRRFCRRPGVPAICWWIGRCGMGPRSNCPARFACTRTSASRFTASRRAVARSRRRTPAAFCGRTRAEGEDRRADQIGVEQCRGG